MTLSFWLPVNHMLIIFTGNYKNVTLKSCMRKQEIFPKVTNGLDSDKVLGKAEVTLLSAAPGRHESKLWPLVLLRSHSYDCTQLYGNCLKFVHGISSVKLSMLTYDSLQTSCYMSDT